MSEIECEFCGEKLQTKSSLNLHRAKTKACIAHQIKKLGKPLSEINKEKKAAEEARIAKKKAEKAERDKKKAEKAKKKIEAEKDRKEAEKAYREAEEEIARKASQKEDTSEDEIDENAEIPLSSSDDESHLSSEDESSSSSEESEEETYKIEEPSTVQEVFNNIENHHNPARLNNLFKKKQTTIKTEIIRDDQPPEVHKRKIEEHLSPNIEKIVSSEQAPIIDIKALSEDINKNIEKKITLSITSLENKVNSLLDVIGKVNNSISALEKRMKSIEPPKDVEKDIERIMDNKLHEMFYITKKMLAEVESKNDLLDIFRENMEDIVENHYDLYKKFKYIKDDMEDMVYDKGSQRSGRRR
jgi:hypothetical protein